MDPHSPFRRSPCSPLSPNPCLESAFPSLRFPHGNQSLPRHRPRSSTASAARLAAAKPVTPPAPLARDSPSGRPAQAGLRPDPAPGAHAPQREGAERLRACADLGTQSQPAVSHHLALLRHGRLIEPQAVRQAQFLRPDRRRPRTGRGGQLDRRLIFEVQSRLRRVRETDSQRAVRLPRPWQRRVVGIVLSSGRTVSRSGRLGSQALVQDLLVGKPWFSGRRSPAGRRARSTTLGHPRPVIRGRGRTALALALAVATDPSRSRRLPLGMTVVRIDGGASLSASLSQCSRP